MFRFFNKKKRLPVEKLEDPIARQHHETRIINLSRELGDLIDRLNDVNKSSPRSTNLNKETDLIIHRMAIIKHEIDIREDFL